MMNDLNQDVNPVIDKSGNKCWYLNGEFHRDDGPAIEFVDGDKFWYQNGEFHRDNGPAVEWANGDKYWYRHNKIHRDDGPAMEFSNGDKQWYLEGVEVKEEDILTTGRSQE